MLKLLKPRPLVLAGTLGFLGVAMGAFGAHALRDTLSEAQLRIYQTAVQYQLIHSVVLVALALAPKFLRLAFTLFAAGIAVFSGSLFLLCFTGAGWLGAITPFGGMALLAGWVCVIVEGVSRGRDS